MLKFISYILKTLLPISSDVVGNWKMIEMVVAIANIVKR